MIKLSDEVERLKNVAIKPHWGDDEGARIIAVERIATYGVATIPILLEISKRADSYLTKHCATECVLKLQSSDGTKNLNPTSSAISMWEGH